MRSTFFGIEIARRALFAQQRAMDVASHNIANANNPIYSRQRAEMATTPPYAAPGTAPGGTAGQVGTGVWVEEIVRLRDEFLDARIRSQAQIESYWELQRDVLQQIERIFNEPSEQGVRTALDAFWEALQDLSVTPESTAVRAVVVQRGQLLADAVKTVFRQLEMLRGDLDRSLELKVKRLNTLSAELAALNGQIARVAASGQNPNDLLDRRDAILEEMARLAAVSVTFRSVNVDGREPAKQAAVSVGGLTLVDGEISHELVVSGTAPDRQVFWESSSGPQVTFSGGEIRSILDLRDRGGSQGLGVLELMEQVDDWVEALVTAFNAQHSSGYDLGSPPGQGGDFFVADRDGDGWFVDEVDVDPAVAADPRLVAAAESSGAPGDGENARKLAGVLKTITHPPLGGATLPDYWASLVGRIGVRSQEAQTMADNQALVVEQLEGLRQSVSGVSLDEEMADLIRFEHAYGAAARAMTAMDEALDTLINRTGLVGR